ACRDRDVRPGLNQGLHESPYRSHRRLHPAGDRVRPRQGRVRETRPPLTPKTTGRVSRPVRSMVVDWALDQAVLVRKARSLGPVRHAELAIDVRQVELDGLLRDPELLADR